MRNDNMDITFDALNGHDTSPTSRDKPISVKCYYSSNAEVNAKHAISRSNQLMPYKKLSVQFITYTQEHYKQVRAVYVQTESRA